MGEGDEEVGFVVAAGVAVALAELIILRAEFATPMNSFSGFELVVVCPSTLVTPNAARAIVKGSWRCISGPRKKCMEDGKVEARQMLRVTGSLAAHTLYSNKSAVRPV